jgi:peptidyl-tRNA hydrolase
MNFSYQNHMLAQNPPLGAHSNVDKPEIVIQPLKLSETSYVTSQSMPEIANANTQKCTLEKEKSEDELSHNQSRTEKTELEHSKDPDKYATNHEAGANSHLTISPVAQE